MEQFLYRAWQEVDGEFSLYDGESGNFMSHYATKEEIIQRFTLDTQMDGCSYRIDFRLSNPAVDETYILIPVA